MSSERTLPWILSALVLGVSVACSDSEPGDDGGSSGSAGKGGGAGTGGSAGTGGKGGSSSGTGGSGDAGMGGEGAPAGGSDAGGTASSGAGEGGTPAAGGDAGASGSAGAGGAPPGASDTLCGVRPGGDLSGEHVLRFETAAGDVVQLERAYETWGVGESVIYRLDGMGIRFGGEEICIGASDTLEYVNTHHNWYDEAHGEKDGMRYSLRMQWDGEDTFAVYDEDGEAVLEPTVLVWTGYPTFCYVCFQSTMIAITEILANNTSFYPDEQSEYEPWIELYNAGSDDVDLTGWTLSNAFSERDRWTFPSMTLPRQQTLVVFADGEPAEGPLHTSFELSAAGGQVILTAPDGSTDGGVVYGAQAPDESLAYTWTDGYVTSDAPAPGEPPPEPQ